MDAELAGHLDTLENLRAEQARQLHGELGGILASARLILSTLGTAPDPETLARLDARLAEALAIKQRVVESLRPGLLEHFGPGAALTSHFETKCRAAGVAFQADVPFGLPVPAPVDGILLYRVGEAALALALDDAVLTIHLSVAIEAGRYRLQVVAGMSAGKVVKAPVLDVLVSWLARHGGSLVCRIEGACWVVDAAIPLR